MNRPPGLLSTLPGREDDVLHVHLHVRLCAQKLHHHVPEGEGQENAPNQSPSLLPISIHRRVITQLHLVLPVPLGMKV